MPIYDDREGTMNCPNCGKQVADSARFCNHCGMSLGNGDKATQTVETVPVPGEGRKPHATGAAMPGGAPNSAPNGSPRSPHVPYPGNARPSDAYASSNIPSGGSSGASSSNKKSARTVVIVVVAALTLLMATCTAFCVSGAISLSNYAKSTKYPVTFTISITSEFDGTSSRIPVEVTGRDVSGNDVNETVFLAYSGVDVELPEGEYQVKAVGSPIASDGTIYKVPSTTIDFEVSSKKATNKNGGVTVQKVLSFLPIAPKDMTDEQIKDAIAWARKDEKSNADIGQLEKATQQRKESAKSTTGK